MNTLPAIPPAILRAEDLGRSVNGKTLLEKITFELHAGEALAIVGPSGSGKSTLLRLLNRLDEPTAGTVYIDGSDYKGIEPRVLRRRVGLVTQRPFLFPGTVEQNLRYGPLQRGEIVSDEILSELLGKVCLTGYSSRNVANLSGGESQRVSVARTLANSPSILLLDEPTSALDDASKIEIESLLLNIVHEQKLACVLVTHDKAQAVRMAGRALLLADGKVIRSGPTGEVTHA